MAAALAAMRGDGTLFERYGEIVRVMTDGGIVPLNLAGILLELDRLVRWMKNAKATDDLVPCDCPRPVAEGVMAMRGRWALPKLDAVTTAPLYHPGAGRIIERDGYDAETGTLFLKMRHKAEYEDVVIWFGTPSSGDSGSLSSGASGDQAEMPDEAANP